MAEVMMDKAVKTVVFSLFLGAVTLGAAGCELGYEREEIEEEREREGIVREEEIREGEEIEEED
ncbi:hypothetical protein IFO70_26705 [Phormidium tenue FACHB-886]|nr:hypothetical protein [Phormidium tenue FACHB-886]